MVNEQKEKEPSLQDLDEDQKQVYDLILNTRQNIFIQGQAGTGKSVIIKLVKQNSTKKTLYMAFTGTAAENIGGTTINSQFGLGVTNFYPQKNYYFKNMEPLKNVISKTEMIVIDEASMLRADIFDVVNKLCRLAKGNFEDPFGGIQIILIGDLYQLAPIYGNDKETTNFLKDTYKSEHPFFFSSEAYKQGNFITKELTQVHRCNEIMAKHLYEISHYNDINSVQKAIDYFNSRIYEKEDILTKTKDITILAHHNDVVEQINNHRLNELEAPDVIFKAVQNWDKEPPVLPELKLRRGAFVMICRNDRDKRYTNGTKGYILDIRKDTSTESVTDEDIVIVKLLNGTQVDIKANTWNEQLFTEDEHGQFKLSDTGHFYKQMPLKLAYALTIHKSQGQTLDKLFLKLKDQKVLYPALIYVALSRAKTLKGIFLNRRLDIADIHTCKTVKDFFKNVIIQNSIKDTNEKNIDIEDIVEEHIQPTKSKKNQEHSKVPDDIKKLRRKLYQDIEKVLEKYEVKDNEIVNNKELYKLQEENKKLKQELAKIKEENLVLKQSSKNQRPMQMDTISFPKKEFFIDNKACSMKEFESFIRNKGMSVHILIYYDSGKTEERIWRATNFTESSSLSRNLASGYLRGWKRNHIVGIKVEVNT